MGRSLKDLVREFCARTNIPRPSTVAGSTDAQIIQVMALLNEELDESTSRENFAWLQRECVFTAVSGELQGTLADLLQGDTMWKVVPETFFNRTTHLVCAGPVGETEWQQYKALQAGMLPRFRFWNESLYLQPDPTPGDVYAFEYLSQQCVKDALSGGYKRYFTSDDDTCVIDDAVLLSALRWRWKAEKGLDYSEDFSRYERIRAAYIMTTGLKPTVDLSGQRNVQGPGIIIPPGTWAIPGGPNT